jgi:hypothetical protein
LSIGGLHISQNPLHSANSKNEKRELTDDLASRDAVRLELESTLKANFDELGRLSSEQQQLREESARLSADKKALA